jgi:phage recombination protein Bet
MNTTTRPARDQAISRINTDQDNAVAAAQEARQRPSALANMAARLNISQQQLMATLKSTVFKGASDNEFAALIVVADAYKLNPLLKEIYAFPVKGGGIAPMVSIDGWIKITNDHPEFDGIEFKDMADANGKLYAIAATIYRKDRSRPIQIIEYLEECKRNTDPWNKSPARMLRHRALMQCARYAFGFSGIGAEDDAEVYALTPATPMMRDVTPPTRGDTTALPAAATETVDADGVVTDGATEPKPEPAAAVDGDGADQGEEALYDQITAKINRAETVIAVQRAVASIPEAMRETWQSSLRELAMAKDAELRGGAK